MYEYFKLNWVTHLDNKGMPGRHGKEKIPFSSSSSPPPVRSSSLRHTPTSLRRRAFKKGNAKTIICASRLLIKPCLTPADQSTLSQTLTEINIVNLIQ